MAVLQVSQIQIRSGFYSELGQLSRGEFGWAIDKLRLFIGNGTTEQGAPYPGNTEVLTTQAMTEIMAGSLSSFEYTFKGLASGYEVQTGATVSAKIVRNVQAKLDDTVNVKDFGAIGDGVVNDLLAIQRAIDQIYDRQAAATDPETRRQINFYPGVYIVAGELRIPPYCTLKGIGKGSVVIRQVSELATCLLKLTSSTGSDDSSMIANGVSPQYVEISNIVFETTRDIPLAKIESAHDVIFDRCRFIGIRQEPGNITAGSGVAIDSRYYPTDSIKFFNCDFTNLTFAANVRETLGTKNIVFDSCGFNELYRGINFETGFNGNTQASLKVTNSVFNRIYQHGIYSGNNVNDVVSMTNTFINVGTAFNANANATVVSSVIRFGGRSSYSFGDTHLRNEYQDSVLSSIEHTSPNTVSIDSAGLIKFGKTYQTLGNTVIVANSTVRDIPLHPNFLNGQINYQLKRGTANRTGSLQFSSDPSTGQCQYKDSYVEHIDTGVELDIEYNSTYITARPVLKITADNRGNNTTFIYDIKSTSLI